MIQFTILTIFGFAAMEIFSYAVHRYVFHGVLWRIHETHHTPRQGWFELNDIFSLAFALISICLMIFADKSFVSSVSFPIGLGIAVYGIFYFITHDLFTHRRLLPFKSQNSILLTIRAAHQKHHQSIEKLGTEPFGLFIFNYKKFSEKTKGARMSSSANARINSKSE
jgi:beta-carotene 3-hydroxylase